MNYMGTKFSTKKEFNRYKNRITGRGYEQGVFVYEVKSANGYTFYTRRREEFTGLLSLNRRLREATGANQHITIRVVLAPKGPFLPEYMAELFEEGN